MELDSFLATPRWEILKIISDKPSSPIEIAEKTKTTVSFVSQQLKLLEAAQIVSKEKTGAFEKGKPRNIFSISKDIIYFTILTKGFGDKKSLNLEEYQKALLKTWLLNNKTLQLFLEGLLFKFKDNFNEIYAILIDEKKTNPSLILFVDDKKLQQTLEFMFKKNNEKIKFEFFQLSDLNKISALELFPIYQSNLFLKKLEDEKTKLKKE